MTYEELKKEKKALEQKAESFYHKIDVLKEKYIEEHQPFPIKRYQRMMVRLRVTEEHRKCLDERSKKMRKYQLGYEYCVTGIFIGFAIGDNGELRPCFFGDNGYSRYDEIVSMEMTAEQPIGDCTKCRLYKDGLCYMMGGMTISERLATHKVKDGDVVCPHYEERTELWQDGKHYPNVTIVRRKKGTFYRIYSLNWDYFTEWEENIIKANYSFERV